MSPEEYLLGIFGEYKVESFKFRSLGYFSNFIDKDGQIKGSGFRQKKEESINVAVSESVERYIFQKCYNNRTCQTEDYPSSCGFAAGLNKQKTELRSILEGLERWTIANWIDKKFFIPQIKNDSLFEKTPMFDQFDNISRYQLNFYKDFNDIPFDITIGICICEKNNGVYMGSRACLLNDNPWEHALIEAWISYLNIENEVINNSSNDFIEKRVLYFSKHRNEGLSQIPSDKNKSWPRAIQKFSSYAADPQSPFHVYRTIFKDYIPWHIGSEDRFVY